MISPDALADYLPRQRWFGGPNDRAVDAIVLATETILKDTFPMLVRVDVDLTVGGDVTRYQLLLGVRPAGEPAEFLHGSDDAVLGDVDTHAGAGFAYDALLDAELGLHLLHLVAPDEEAKRVRPVGVEQTNTSLVYDDRLILKVFRRLADGPNPDVEVTTRLAQVGFTSVADPLATWRDDGQDLALLQRYLSDGVDGWSLALTSLRDLYAEPVHPGQAGGDFASEAERLGAMTAELHAALAEAFGREEPDVEAWLAPMSAQLDRTNHAALDRRRVQALLERLRSVEQLGPAIRTHGDYHLGQVMRTDLGWYVLDFEGEPARPVEERRTLTSPLKDVAAMLRSFQYAARFVLRDRDEPEAAAELAHLARAWERRNRAAFLDGYLPAAEKESLLPADPAARAAVLATFELDKAVYELGYEMAHRPDWAGIPLSAILGIIETAP